MCRSAQRSIAPSPPVSRTDERWRLRRHSSHPVHMADTHTLYRVLKVDPGAPYDVIQAAYRALARTFHPDLGGDPDEMKRINEAWEILGDLRKRAAYDAALRAAASTAPAARGGASSDATQPSTWAPRPVDDHAGPPPGYPSGPVMTYGRYKGWSLGEIARYDRRFLEWLRRVPAGMAMRAQIDAALRQASFGRGLGGRPVAETAPRPSGTIDGRVAARW